MNLKKLSRVAVVLLACLATTTALAGTITTKTYCKNGMTYTNTYDDGMLVKTSWVYTECTQ